MEDIVKKFEHLYQVISNREFLRMESLGGEIPFFISAFDPKQQVEVEKASSINRHPRSAEILAFAAISFAVQKGLHKRAYQLL